LKNEKGKSNWGGGPAKGERKGGTVEGLRESKRKRGFITVVAPRGADGTKKNTNEKMTRGGIGNLQKR